MRQSHSFSSRCPYCSSPLIGDREAGELVCPTCGAVLADAMEFEGPDWKAVDPEDKLKKSRTGAPLTFTQHDFGLSTSIDTSGTDFSGNRLNGDGRASAARMKMWQSRLRTMDSKERSTANVLQRILDNAGRLSLPPNVAETAAYNFRQYQKKGQAKGRSSVGLASAILYLSCRQCDVNRSLSEIAHKCGVEKKAVAKYYRQIVMEMGIERVPAASITNHIAKLSNNLAISPRVERLAAELETKVSAATISGGRAPSGLAAAYIYIAAALLNEHLPQREISEKANVTEVTIRKRCKELFENYSISVSLKAA
ncbi:MAG: transcription initiation factor IIB [Nitrososphaerota archaeon]|nr:transcription initiation factor IIB [Nitrososphaerota archaeon]MDG6939475.1 transcription initiation factor IIB [Nitrososphaerota archaeon]